MKKFICILLCFAFLLSSAYAVDLSKENCKTSNLHGAKMTNLKTNRYDGTRPLIVFFPGSQEVTSAYNATGFVRNHHLYDNIDCDLIIITLAERFDHYDFKNAVTYLYKFVSETYGDTPVTIIADAVSFGGYGGCYMADYFTRNGLTVSELNLADACGAYCIKADWIRSIAGAGTHVNIWGCYTTATISKETRAIMEELTGTDNYTGTMVHAGHASVLDMAILNFGLHAEFMNET